MVGYHGLSVRSSNQRQSGENGTSNATGLPIAPARCATDVSTRDNEIEHCHDRGGVGEIAELLAELQDAMLAQNLRLRLADVFLQADEIEARHRQHPGKRSSGIERCRSLKCALLPAQHIPTRRRPFPGSLSRHFASRSCMRPDIRNVGRDRREFGSERQRQAQHRTIQIEIRQHSPRANTPAAPKTVPRRVLRLG